MADSQSTLCWSGISVGEAWVLGGRGQFNIQTVPSVPGEIFPLSQMMKLVLFDLFNSDITAQVTNKV